MKELIIKVIAIVVAIILANWLFWHLVGLVTLTAAMLAPVIVLAGVLYLGYRYYRWRTFRLDKHTAYRLWNTSGKAVYVFHAEPSVEDMAKVQDELNVASLELQGQVFGVDNDTEVSVLEDEGTGAVKVKIADPQAREKVGWVPRETVILPGKQLTG